MRRSDLQTWTVMAVLVLLATVQLARAEEPAATAAAPAALNSAQHLALRKEAEAAFAQAAYPAAAARYALLAQQPAASLDDRIWLGHAYQLQEDWPRAVAAYLAAEASLVPKPAPATTPAPEPATTPATTPQDLERGRRGTTLENPFAAEQTLAQRIELRYLAARLQHQQLHDPQAAVATLAGAVALCPPLNRPIPQMAAEYQQHLADALRALSDPALAHALRNNRGGGPSQQYGELALELLAQLQEETQQWPAALDSRTRLRLARQNTWRDNSLSDLAAHARAAVRLPAADRPNDIPGLLQPGPDPLLLDLAKPEVLAQASSFRLSPGTFVLCPPQGQEFADIELAAEVEVLNPGHAVQIGLNYLPPGASFWTRIGSMMGRDVEVRQEQDRQTRRGRWNVPAGGGPLFLEVFQGQDSFKAHRLTLTATYRAAAAAPPAPPVPATWFQVEVHPPRGELTVDDRRWTPNSNSDGLKPGRHEVAYVSRDGEKEAVATFEAVAGKRYALFLNLESPFTLASTNLLDATLDGPRATAASLIQLPDGRYLLAFTRAGRQIMLTTSKDLQTWDQPWPLPHNLSFDTIEPALTLDHQGQIHLAYFSNRLSLEPQGSGGYRLWLTGSKDAKSWSPPRPVAGAFDSGWPLSAPQLLSTADGQAHLFWRAQAAHGASFATLSPLADLPWAKTARDARNIRVTPAPDGRLHAVFAPFVGRGIFHVTRDPSGQWSTPQQILAAPPNAFVHHPQLLVSADRCALLYEANDGTYLARGPLTDPAKLAPPVKLATHTTSRLAPVLATPKEYLFLAGHETVWLLRAPHDEVLGK